MLCFNDTVANFNRIRDRFLFVCFCGKNISREVKFTRSI